MTDFFDKMLILYKRHEKIRMKWEEFIGIIHRLYEDSQYPTPTKLRDNSRLEFIMSPERVFCQFRFNGKKGIIQFGYVELNEFGQNIDIFSKESLVFDSLGNISLNESGLMSWNMCDISDIKEYFFFPYLLKTFNSITINNERGTHG